MFVRFASKIMIGLVSATVGVFEGSQLLQPANRIKAARQIKQADVSFNEVLGPHSSSELIAVAPEAELWPEMSPGRCSMAKNSRVLSQAACQQLAIDEGNTYYQFRDGNKKNKPCLTMSKCDSISAKTGSKFKIFHTELPLSPTPAPAPTRKCKQLYATGFRCPPGYTKQDRFLKCGRSRSAKYSEPCESACCTPAKCSVVDNGATYNFSSAKAKCESLGQTLPIIVDARANSELEATLRARAARGQADRIWLGAEYADDGGGPFLLQTQLLDASITQKGPQGGFQWLDGSVMTKSYVNFDGAGMFGNGFPSSYPGDALIFNEDGSWEVTAGSGEESVACCQTEEACYQWPGEFASLSRAPVSHAPHGLREELGFPMEGESVTEQQLASLDSLGVLTEFLAEGVIQRRPCQPDCLDTDIREDHRCILATFENCPAWMEDGDSYMDDEDFTVKDMCCACGGGNSMVCSVASDCLDGHICLEGFCQVSKCSVVDDTSTHSYKDANIMCQQLGLSLPIIKNRRENKELLTALQNRASSVWLGAQGPWTNQESELEYRWVDGTTSLKTQNGLTDPFEEFKGYWPNFDREGSGILMGESITLLDNGTWVRSNISATNYVACCEGSTIPMFTTTTTTPMNATFDYCGKEWVLNEPVIWTRDSDHNTGISRVQCGSKKYANKIAVCVGRGEYGWGDWYNCEGALPENQCDNMYWVYCNTVQQVDEVVNCGNHDARNCGDCAQGAGEAFCNGQCEWISGQCVPEAGATTPSFLAPP